MGLILPLLFGSSLAFAQDNGQVAKQFYLNGKMLFEEGRYEEAIIAWEKAYEVSEKPVIIYNIAIAHEKVGRYQLAIDMLYRYRIYASQEEQEELVTKIDDLKIKLEIEQQAGVDQSIDDYHVDKVQVSSSPLKEPEENRSSAVVEDTPVETKPERVLSESIDVSNVSMTPVFAAWGATVASLSTGVVFGVLANQSNDMAEYVGGCGTTNKGVLLCTSNSEGEGYFWEARKRAIVADVGYTTSVLSLGTAVWLTYRYAHEPSVPAMSSVWFAPTGVGLQGRF